MISPITTRRIVVDDLETTLKAMQHDGWQVLSIIPCRYERDPDERKAISLAEVIVVLQK